MENGEAQSFDGGTALDLIAPINPLARGQRVVTDEFGDITDDVIEALHEMAMGDVVIAEREQAEIARVAGQEARDLKFGRMVAQIAPESFDYWAAREPGCWGDKQFMREFLRDNEAARVNSRSGRIMVGPGRSRPAQQPRRPGVHGRRGRWAL